MNFKEKGLKRFYSIEREFHAKNLYNNTVLHPLLDYGNEIVGGKDIDLHYLVNFFLNEHKIFHMN